MTENSEIQPNKEVVIAVFDGKDTAEKVLADMEKLGTSEVDALHREGTIVTLDEKGKLSVTTPKTKAKGAASGAVAGVLVGALLGVPVVGAVVGGVAAALSMRVRARRKLDHLALENVELEHFIDSIESNSSIIIAVVEDYYVDGLVDAYIHGR